VHLVVTGSFSGSASARAATNLVLACVGFVAACSSESPHVGSSRGGALAPPVWADTSDTAGTPGVLVWDESLWDETLSVDGGVAEIDAGFDAGLDSGVDAGPVGCDPSDPGRAPGNPDPIDAAGYDSNCDMVDGVLGAIVFVSPTGDDARSGSTPDLAVRTIARGIAIAAPAGLDVLIAGEGAAGQPAPVYAQASTLVLAAGVDLYGGYALSFRARGGSTTITGSPIPLVRASGIQLATRVDGLEIVGADAIVQSEETIAVWIDSSGDFVTFANVVIRAGRGADGSSGTTGGPTAGYPGGAGGVSLGCGKGGSNPTYGGGPRGGAPGANANDTCVNLWGSCLAYNATGAAGSVGPRGGDGGNGGSGAANTNGLGVIDVNGWSAVRAFGGSAGEGGSGGGGGGAGADLYQNFCWGCSTNLLGARGGRGQRGGAGGGGGAGGVQGGASIAVFLRDSTVQFVATTIVLGVGGNGGRGGNGASGQVQPWEDSGRGTPARSSCAGSNYASGEAAFGALGGSGGHGGGGGGGNGGPVVGVARLNAAVSGSPSFSGGSPGASGSGGAHGWGGSAPAGVPGPVVTVW